MSGTGASRNMYITNSTTSNYDIKNNIFVNAGSGHPIYISGTTTPLISDYNCLYGTTYVGYITSNHTTLASWQTATGQDANSISVNPSFVNVSNNLKLTNFTGFECFRYPNVNQDIEGMLRTVYTTMGCYTSPLLGSNAAIAEVLHLDKPANVGDTSMLQVALLNAGLDTIKAATINWSFNNVLQPTINWSGVLPSLKLDTFALGTVIYQGGPNEVIVWLSGIGSLTDSLPYDDTLIVTTYACSDSLSGDFIVGNNLGADAPSMSEALYVATMCGVKGDITLKFQNGVYDENWNLSDLSNIMGIHTLTITSLSGNRDSVILKPTSGVAILLSNTDNLVIKDMTIDNSTSNAYGLQFTGAANNVEIRNNNFIGDQIGTTAANSLAPIYKAGSTGIANDIRFIGNTIEGGYYGIYFYAGTGSGVGAYGINVVFDSNLIINQYYYATYFYYADFTSLSHNTILSRITNAHTYWYGLRLYYCNFNADGNRIHTRTSFQYLNAVYIYYAGYYNSAVSSNFINNEIIGISSSTYYGMYVGTSNNLNIVNNSILMSGTGASRNIHVISSTTSLLDIKNNILVNTSSGYPIYIAAATTPITSDYNCLYGNTNVGYLTSAHTTLASWQTATKQDTNSVSLYPSFMDSTVNLKLNNYSPFSCPKYPNVDYDIDDSLRLIITNMGCYIPIMGGADGALTEILNWNMNALAGDTSYLEVVLLNAGSTNLTTAKIGWSKNGVFQPLVNWTGNLATSQSDTIAIGAMIYQPGYNTVGAWISSLGTLSDTINTNDTVRITNYACDSMLSGYYTIGATGNFADMDEAVAILNTCGIDGPVTFAIQPGTYYQNTTIGYINGTSPTNTITFTSTTGDSSDVVLQRADDPSSSLAAVMITNGENIIIRNLTLSAKSPLPGSYTTSHCIIIDGTSRNIEVRNCYAFGIKNFSSVVTGTNQNPVRILGATVSDVRILNNLIEGGSCGVYVYGVNSTTRISNVVIKDNTIGFVDTYGMYIYYADSVLIEGNVIEQRTGSLTPGNLYGIYNYYANSDILSNKIHAASFYYGIYTSYMNDASARPGLIANNELIGDVTSTSYRGIYLNSYTNAKVYHNSMYIGGAVAGYGLYVVSSAYTYVDIKNNNLLLNTDGDGYPIYLAATTYLGTQWLVDYNNYYNVQGTNIGYAGGAKTTLAAWKATVTTDTHSVNMYPNFLDINTSMMLLDSNGFTCPRLVDVTYDIQDSLRSPLTTIGAYHFEPARRDATPTAFISPLTTEAAGVSIPIRVLLGNNGLDTITSLMIGYTVNGIAATPYSWNGVLLAGDTTSVQLGSFAPLLYANTLVVYTYLPNGKSDQFTLNDTLSMEMFGCDSAMRGTYTIGATGVFKSIDKAIQAVEHCGMSGSIVFEIQSGTYANRLEIGAIQGASDSTTITFVSQTRNAANVKINVGFTALRLIDASHLNFQYLSIHGSVIGVDLIGTCTNIEFYACTISTITTSNHTSYRAVNYDNTSGSGDYLNDVRFIKNTISGGYYNMYLRYPGSSTTDMGNCLITVDSNTLKDAYYYGIYSYYYGKYKSISHNTITTRSEATLQYGIYLYYYNTVDELIGNKVTMNSTTTAYGLYLYYYLNQYFATQNALVANNIVRIPQATTPYGIYTANLNALIYNNTVSINGTSTQYGIYISTMSSTYALEVKNNIFTTLGSGTGYPLYVGTASYALQANGTYLDYNDYYSSGPNVGYVGVAMTSLSALQTATGQDNNSINVNPNFISTTNLKLTSYNGLRCPRMPDVGRDIQNYLRSSITNMGAYSKDPINIDAELAEFIGFSDAYASGGNHPIRVVIRNAGFNPMTSATITAKINNVNITPISYTASTPLVYGASDTVSLGSFAFNAGINNIIAAVTMTGDTLQDNDTIRDSRYMCTFIVGGEYVIGSSPAADYPSVDSLMADVLRCGINADVTLKFESGTYTGSWDFTDLDYFFKNYTLTITSLANHRDSVIFANASGVLLTLNNTHNVVVRNVTLDATAGTYAVQFTGSTSNITFDSCNILASLTATASTYAAIYKGSSTGSLNGLSIKHCLIDGGYYGTYIYGSSSDYANAVTIDSNIISNQYYYGIYNYYVNATSTSYNTITPRSVNQNVSWYGIYLNYNRNGGNIIGNRISANNAGITSTLYGMYTYYTDTALVANNEIRLNSSAGTTYGMYIDYPRAVNYLHNSILVTGTSNTARALHWYVYGNDSWDATLQNNIFVCTSSGTTPYAIYLAGTYSAAYAHNYRIDYNNYYSSGNMGYVGSAQPTLATWQATVASDAHSTFALPSFVNVTQNLRLSSYTGFIVPQDTNVLTDIEGVVRGVFTAKGAYEAEYLLLNAALLDFDTTSLLYNVSCPVTLTLLNSGKTTLTSATIAWTFNGVSQTSIPWTGSLATHMTAVIHVGNIVPIAGTNTVRAWVANPNSGTDMDPSNDTIALSMYACTGPMTGVYSVGGVSPDFKEINDAITAMNECGIAGNVTLSVRSGVYDPIMISGSVKGASDTNIVIVTSAAGNADSVVFAGGSALSLMNASHFTFTKVTFDANIGGYAVFISGNTENIEISHCNIYADSLGTASTTAGIYKGSGSGIANNVRIIRNTINGGYYGIYFYGGTGTADYGYNITIDSNRVTNQYYYGTYFYYTDFTSVSHNTILSRITNAHTYWYGLRFYYCNFNAYGNRIHARTSFQYLNTVYIYYAGYNNSTVYSNFINNEVIGTTSSTYYGLYLGSSNKLNIYNNSIYLDGTGVSRNIHIVNSTTSDYVIKNNLLVNVGSGYPIYISGTTTPLTSDYNCLYGLNNVGYITSAHTTLASWQTATGQDANSVSVSPAFIDVNTSLELSDYSPFIAPRLTAVPVDIRGAHRTVLTMMGAYSMPLFEGYNLELTKIISPKNVTDIHCYDDFTDVKVVVENGGTKTYHFDTNSVNIHLEVSGAYNYQSDTIINIGSLLPSKSDTFEIHNMLSVSLPGTYYITVYLSSALDTMYADDTLRMTYTVNKINLPYDVNFSTMPSELIIKQIQGLVNWEVESGTGSNPAIAPVYGTGRLTFGSEWGIGSVSQVILNGLDLRGTLNPKLEFWYAHDASSTENDFVTVKMSTDGGASSQTLKNVYRYDAAYTTPGWVHYEIDLSAYDQASCLSLIIGANSFGGANQNIDRIRISSEQDIALTLIAPQEGDLIACDLENKTIQVVIENMTSQAIDFDTDTTKVEVKISGAINHLYPYPLSGKLQGNAKDTLLITNVFDLSGSGTYTIEAYIHSIDTNASNDTSKKTLLINPDLEIVNVVGVDEVNCKFMGDSVYVSFDIINKGNLVVNEIPVRLQINNASDIVDTIYFVLNAGDTITHDFTQAYVVPVVTETQPYYIVKVKTELACDANNVNNIKNITACVEIPEVIDLRVQAVNKPIETLCDTGLHAVNVSVTLENVGTNDISSAVVHVEVDSAGVILASFFETTGAIFSEDILVHVFTQSYTVPNFDGNYSVKVYVEAITDDQDLTNDTLLVNACAVLNDVSIHEVSELNWTLGQNIPNPTSVTTKIPYVISQDGKVVFNVMSVNGQVLYKEEVQASSGAHYLELNTQTLSNGIYYYSMEYQGQRIVKKMTIQK